jgi:hypothetical protein
MRDQTKMDPVRAFTDFFSNLREGIKKNIYSLDNF